MKRFTSFCLVLLATAQLVLAQSCKSNWSGKTVEGVGSVSRQTRETEGFTRVASSISGNVFVKVGNSFKVEVEAQENLKEYIVTELKGKTLNIKYKDNFSLNTKEVLRVYIEAPSFEGFSLSGSGDLNVEGILNSDKLDLSLAGSGDLNVEKIQSNKVVVNLAGSGNISVKNGAAEEGVFSIAGSGDINAEGCSTKTAKCSIAGSGNVQCNPSDTLSASIAGSGDVVYSGSPSVKSSVVGSGSVRGK